YLATSLWALLKGGPHVGRVRVEEHPLVRFRGQPGSARDLACELARPPGRKAYEVAGLVRRSANDTVERVAAHGEKDFIDDLARAFAGVFAHERVQRLRVRRTAQIDRLVDFRRIRLVGKSGGYGLARGMVDDEADMPGRLRHDEDDGLAVEARRLRR